MLLEGFRSCFSLLTRRQKRDYWIVVAFVSLSSLMDMLGIASIIPVVSALVDFEGAVSKGYLLLYYDYLGAPEKSAFLLLLMLLAVALVCFSGIIGVLAIYARQKYLKRISTDLASRVYNRYMSLPIEKFYEKSSAEFLRDVNGASERISLGVIDSSVVIVSRSIQILTIVSILLIVDISVTLTIVAAISVSYLIIFLGIKRFIQRIARENFEDIKKAQQILLGSYHGYRNLHIDNQMHKYSRRFKELKRETSTKAANIEILGAIPKEFIEVVGLTMMVVSAYLIGQSVTERHNFVATMTLMGIAAFRVLPSAQQTYHAVNRMISSLEVYLRVKQGWGNLTDVFSAKNPPRPKKKYRSLVIQNLSYKNGGNWIFRNFNLTIELQGLYWINGKSGVGKSTLMELISRLRLPTSGGILVDGKELHNVDNEVWWSNLSYVSQDGYIFEGSVKSNVTLESGIIDEQRLNTVAEICDLKTISDEDVFAPEFLLLEGGRNLSGGQRSRMLIARALYKDSQVIILDETLSALDVESSRKILAGISSRFNDRCIFVVSHRQNELPDDRRCISLSESKGNSVEWPRK